MPIYEYECPHCRRLFNFLVRQVGQPKAPACPRCGRTDMRKAFSRFAHVKSGSRPRGAATDAAPVEDAGCPPPDLPGLEGADPNDPRALGRLMRGMAAQAGEKLEPEMEEVCRRLEAGEDPEAIEDRMGDVLGEAGGPAGSGDDTLYEA